MNRNENRSEEEIVKLLRQMPNVQDERSMEEIYSLVKDKANKEIRNTQRKSRKRFNMFPVLATAAAIFLAVLVGMNLDRPEELSSGLSELDKQEPIMEKAPNNREMDDIAKVPPSDTENGITGFVDGEEKQYKINDGIVYYDSFDTRAVYLDQLQKNEIVITLGIPDQQAQNIVPVSVKLNKTNTNWLEHYKEVMAEINEERLSLSDYYPYNGTLSLENNYVVLNLEENHNYDMSSTTETLFFRSLDYFRYQDVELLNLYVQSEPGYFSHTGNVVHERPIKKYAKNGYWWLLTDTQSYLVTYNEEEFESIGEAFDKMKTSIEENDLFPSIPENLSFTMTDNKDGNLIIQFDSNTNLIPEIATVRMIEAMLLTAKDFGYQTVKFENTGVEQIDRFNFSNPIEVPIAPNLVGEKN